MARLGIDLRFLADRLPALASIIVFVNSTIPADANDWRNTSNYPARVNSISWRDGTAIDQSHSISSGSWTVRFGSVLPVAKEGNVGPEVHGLVCTNSLAGTTSCFLVAPVHAHPQNFCIIFGDPQPSIMPTFNIDCPDAINFAP